MIESLQSLSVELFLQRGFSKKWYPMKIGRIRFDIDVAYNIYTNSFGVKAVIRDSNGSFSSVLGAELKRVTNGLGLRSQEDWGHVRCFFRFYFGYSVTVLSFLIIRLIILNSLLCSDYHGTWGNGFSSRFSAYVKGC